MIDQVQFVLNYVQIKKIIHIDSYYFMFQEYFLQNIEQKQNDINKYTLKSVYG